MKSGYSHTSNRPFSGRFRPPPPIRTAALALSDAAGDEVPAPPKAARLPFAFASANGAAAISKPTPMAPAIGLARLFVPQPRSALRHRPRQARPGSTGSPPVSYTHLRAHE